MISSIITRLEETIKRFEFTNFSYTQLKRPLSILIYKDWLKQGLNAEMTYLEKHLAIKAKPQTQWPSAKSVIVIAQNYIPHPSSHNPLPLNEVQIAKYAQGHDYHHWFLQKLDDLCKELKSQFPGEDFVAMTDSAPIMERNWAYESGLGWFGKNSCLINKDYGSFHFLGEIVTSLELQARKDLHHDLCGSCTKCIDACPTMAIEEGKKIDANKCISYWTIETRKTPPKSIINNFTNWLFGCDICQDVCPWNIKNFKLTKNINNKPNVNQLVDDLHWLLQESNHQLKKN